MTDHKSKNSNRGGARSNAGRKPGAANRATKAAREMAEATGVTPLQFMLERMRDALAPMEDRMDMAKAAAPYIHSKLSTVDHSSSDGSMSPGPTVIEFVEPDASDD